MKKLEQLSLIIFFCMPAANTLSLEKGMQIIQKLKTTKPLSAVSSRLHKKISKSQKEKQPNGILVTITDNPKKLNQVHRIFNAIEKGDLAKVKNIASTKINLNYFYLPNMSNKADYTYSSTKHDEFCSALSYADTILEKSCQYTNTEIIKYLLNNGAQLTAGCFNKIMPYGHAQRGWRMGDIKEESIPVLICLLNHFRDLPIKNKEILQSELEILFKLIFERTLYNSQSEQKKRELELFALRLFLMNGFSASTIIQEGLDSHPLLSKATENNAISTVKILLFYGADICQGSKYYVDSNKLELPWQKTNDPYLKGLLSIDPTKIKEYEQDPVKYKQLHPDEFNPVKRYPKEFKDEFEWHDHYQKEQLVQQNGSILNYLNKREIERID